MNNATSSDLLTSSAVILAGPGALCDLILLGDATNAATVTIYDNKTSAAGLVLAKIVVKAGLTYESYLPDCPIVANNGLYMSISGTGAACIVHYTPS